MVNQEEAQILLEGKESTMEKFSAATKAVGACYQHIIDAGELSSADAQQLGTLLIARLSESVLLGGSLTRVSQELIKEGLEGKKNPLSDEVIGLWEKLRNPFQEALRGALEGDYMTVKNQLRKLTGGKIPPKRFDTEELKGKLLTLVSSMDDTGVKFILPDPAFTDPKFSKPDAQ